MPNHLLAEIVQTAVLVNPLQQVLILRTREGKWQLPGGRLNEQERWDVGLRREIEEETKITDVKILSILMVDNWEFRGVLMYGTYFLCRTNKVDVVLSEEHTDYRWLGRGDDLTQFDWWHENLRILTEKALRMQSSE